MDRREFVDRLDFDNQGVFDQEINDVPSCELDAFVLDGQSDLAAIGDPSKLQLAAEASVVAGLQKARAQMTMYLDCCPNDFFTDWIGGMLDEPHGRSWKSRTIRVLVQDSPSKFVRTLLFPPRIRVVQHQPECIRAASVLPW